MHFVPLSVRGAMGGTFRTTEVHFVPFEIVNPVRGTKCTASPTQPKFVPPLSSYSLCR